MIKKRFLSMLVLLAAVATGAMAQTGYKGAALPAGPDMSGDVINVTAANAQYVLDGAYGSINGKTINFTENVTSLLDLARPTKYAGSGTTVSGTTYTRTLSNVTFTANSGVTLAGFYCTAGATNWSVNKDVMYLNNVYNYVTDGNGNYTRIKTVSNVTFDGLTINAPSGTLSAVFAFGKPGYLTMDGITFTNCTITNSNGHGLYFCSLDQDCMQYGAISITNSIIQGTASDRSGVIIEGVGYSNTVITNNYIVGYHNAIQIENPGNGGSQPQSVTITGNFLKSNNKYPVNLYKLTSNMFTFTGNVVVAGASGKHVGHFHGNASGNLWAANGSAPDANGRITTTLTAPALYGNDNDVTSTSYYSTAVVNTSSDIWVKFDVTGVTLSQTEASLTVGDTVRLTPTLAPEGQTDQTVTWATSDAAVATVSNEGVVTAVAAGTATITATATNGTAATTDDKTATCTVTVAEPTYTVTLKSGTEDATSWQGKAGEGDYQELPLTGLEAGTAVSFKYFGTKKVESVKAVKKKAAASIPLDNTTTAWTAGTYTVPAGGLTYSDAITVSGNVTLVLTDGETLTLNKGISLAEGATLTIQGNGTMNVNGTNNSTASTVAGTGTLVLTSGTLTATGGNGQGGWDSGTGAAGGAAINGTVIVDGGTLTAKGGNGGNLGYMAVYGQGGAGGAAISGSVTVNDGTLTATGGKGGNVGDDSSDSHGGAGGAAIGGSLTINAGTMTTTNGAAGSVGSGTWGCSGGAAGKAVAGTVTDNR